MANIYNYSGRDYTAALERLYTLLRSEVSELTDFNHSDAGISLIRLLARESDQLAFYLDQAFAEGFVPTAQFKQSLCDLGQLVGYLPAISSAASTTVTITRDQAVGSVVIPKYSAFTRSDGMTYLAMDDYTMPGGTNTMGVEVFQGTLVTDVVAPGDFSLEDFSGLYSYNLGTGVAARTVTVVGQSEVEWTEVGSFWRSSTTDLHYLLRLYADVWEGETDTVFLVLGPVGLPGASLTVTYIRTDGADGNCGYGRITGVPSGFEGDITCTNATAATGGAPVETTASIRAMIPAMVRTQRRGLTCEDYETLISSVAGVLHVQVIDRNDNPDYWPHMYVIIYAVPEGGGPMSGSLKNEIWDQCAEWGHLGAWRGRYILRDATEDDVDVSVRIGVVDGYNSGTVSAAASAAITTLLSADNQTIAGTLSYSDIHQTVSAVAGVSWVDIDSPADDVVAEDGHINVAGTITVTVS